MSKQPLLYVGAWLQSGGEVVQMLTYPKGQVIGTLSGLTRPPLYLCSDSAGNVYVVGVRFGRYAPVYVFAHGANNPSQTLNDPGDPASCSVDPNTGNLAVANVDNPYYGKGDGNVAIFRKGTGNAETFQSKSVPTFVGCGYDNNGNLLLDGIDRRDQIALRLLKRHGKTLTAVSFNKPFYEPGPIQWTGREFAIGYASRHAFYRVAISGSTARSIGTTRLGYRNYRLDGEFWIYKGAAVAIIGPKERADSWIGFWEYPTGGRATKVLKRTYNNMALTGLTISVATRR